MKVFSRVFAFFLLCVVMATLLAPASAQSAGQNDGQFDVATEGIVSNYYPVDREKGFITGITPGTAVQKILNTCAPAGLTASGETAVTGMTITYGDGTASLTAVVTGDVNGDGELTITDMLMIKSAILGQSLSDAAAVAGDLNFDGDVTITDFLKAKSNLLGLETVELPGVQDALLLLMPGESVSWATEAAAAYRTGDAELITVSEDGTVTALAQEGSTFVYALDVDGNLINRQLVTVLDEPLTFRLGKNSLRLNIGQTHTINPVLNHPITAQFHWESSDTNVVTVENGVLTAGYPGIATITVSLDNGYQEEISITVAPPITDIAIERKLYKIKPGNSKQLQLLVEPADTGEEIIWTSSDPNIATVAPDGTVTGVDYGTVTITATGKYSGLSAQCDVKICDVIQVAITYDDGPSVHTERLLDFLKENDIRVTFFLVANRMSTYKSFVQREVAEGHEIGYHSFNHTIQTTLSSEKITSDFKWSDDKLYELTGARFTLWRTPGGGYNNRVVAAVDLPHILWSLDTVDWKTRNATAVYNSLMKYSDDGDIILMHDLHGTTVDGSMRALKEMLEGDYEFLTVTELLSRDGTPPEDHKTYYSG